MKCMSARIFAFLISVHSGGIFGKVFSGSSTLYQTEYSEYLKHMFMIGAFVIVSQLDFYPYLTRKLPFLLHFFYEFFVSLFIFDMVCFAIWCPIVYAIYVTLPQLIASMLGLGECCCLQSLCSKDQWLFMILLHTVAILFLCSSLYIFGIISVSKKDRSVACMTFRWLSHLKRIHHGIMCTDNTYIEQCNRCNKLFTDETID